MKNNIDKAEMKEEMEKRRKELLKELENPAPRNRAERRAYARKNRK